MSITISVTDPHNEAPAALRSVAHYLTCIAADREAGLGGASVSVSDDLVEKLKVEFASEPETTLADDVEQAEAETVETPEQRQFRLHGNVASSGMEPATPAPAVEYETIVVGTELNPDYTGICAGYDQAALGLSGWDVEGLLKEGYLREVTETRAKPVAPGASATAAPAAPAPGAPAASSGTVDKDGIVWDERIHSNAAEKLSKEGFWKRRKNTSDELWNSVRAELGVAAPAAPAAPAPAAAPAPSAPAAPAAPAANGFAGFTAWMMQHVKAGSINQTDVQLAVQQAGLSSVPELNKRPELIEAVKKSLIDAKGLQA